MTPWLKVAYDHHPADLQTVHLAVAPRQPAPDDPAWTPAYRDTLADGTRVVQIRHAASRGDRVWVMDADGVRAARAL